MITTTELAAAEVARREAIERAKPIPAAKPARVRDELDISRADFEGLSQSARRNWLIDLGGKVTD